MTFSEPESVSVIVPTIGRPDSLRQLLQSLVTQTRQVTEVIVADGSDDEATRHVVDDPGWRGQGLVVKHISVQPPNAVRQRTAAIEIAQGEWLLLLDDDVVLEADCVAELAACLNKDVNVVGVTADFNNQVWSQPTRFWRWYLRYVLGVPENGWQGRVLGPLLRFGYNPVPAEPQPMEWLGSGNSLVRRSAYAQAGGFSDFFLHRCTINEDVDLSIKLARIGQIMFCPDARMAHYHAPSGRVTMSVASEDDLFNRFLILRRTVGLSVTRAMSEVALFFIVETTSNFLGSLRRLNFFGFFARLLGRGRALCRILLLTRQARHLD